MAISLSRRGGAPPSQAAPQASRTRLGGSRVSILVACILFLIIIIFVIGLIAIFVFLILNIFVIILIANPITVGILSLSVGIVSEEAFLPVNQLLHRLVHLRVQYISWIPSCLILTLLGSQLVTGFSRHSW